MHDVVLCHWGNIMSLQCSLGTILGKYLSDRQIQLIGYITNRRSGFGARTQHEILQLTLDRHHNKEHLMHRTNINVTEGSASD